GHSLPLLLEALSVPAIARYALPALPARPTANGGVACVPHRATRSISPPCARCRGHGPLPNGRAHARTTGSVSVRVAVRTRGACPPAILIAEDDPNGCRC